MWIYISANVWKPYGLEGRWGSLIFELGKQCVLQFGLLTGMEEVLMDMEMTLGDTD